MLFLLFEGIKHLIVKFFKRGKSMKKVLNYCKHIMLTAAIALTVFTVGKTGVKAADVQMGNLNIGEEKIIELVGDNNFYFNFTTPSSGSFKVSVALIGKRNITTGQTFESGYTYVKLNSNYRDIWSEYTWMDHGIYTSPEFSLGGGKNVTLRINDQLNDFGYTYRILIENVRYSNFEKEVNNSASSATKLKNNKSVTGISNKDNFDWFVFKAPSTGKYKFTAVNTDAEDGGYFYCVGYKTKNKVDYGKNQYIWQGRGWTKINTVKLKKGKKYYIRISDPSREGIHYQVKVKKVK
jgi:hypothetical protein